MTKPKPIAVGFIGRKGAGKSTAGLVLHLHGFVRLHPMHTPRKMLRVMLHDLGVPEDLWDRYLEGDLKNTPIPEIGRSGVELLQTMGYEWGHKCIKPSIWQDLMQRRVQYEGLSRVYSDSIRFEEDAERFRARYNALLIRILGIPREQTTLDDHVSEREQDGIKADFEIKNHGTKAMLHTQVLAIVADRFDADLASP